MLVAEGGEAFAARLFFHFNGTTPAEIYTLSLHDALPICGEPAQLFAWSCRAVDRLHREREVCRRSEEHTSELQSRRDLVCRLLLEKKNAEMCPVFDR